MTETPTSKVALVTGATAGIGRALAFALGRSGFQVGVCGRSAEKVADLITELEVAGIRSAGCRADVGDEADVGILVEVVERTLGPIDTLVNNAGVLIFKPIMELATAEWDETMATNLRSLFLTTRAVLPGMRQRKCGDIVNIASLAGRNGFVGGTAYTASKHAVLGFSKSLMLETRKDGIRVIAICPGSVATRMLTGTGFARTNADRILAPEDVADTVVHTLMLPRRGMISELDIRPSDP